MAAPAYEPAYDTTTPEPSDDTPREGFCSLTDTPADRFAITCAACGRERTLADDYDYSPLQLVTGRPLGWFNGDGEQMCGTCLGLTMKGQLP